MTTQREINTGWFANGIARVAVGIVFAANVSCAVLFMIQPDLYAGGFEIGGLQGRLVVEALGILFLMWNITYPPVLVRPDTQMTLFAVILVQQAVGLAGETWLWLTLPAGHPALWVTIQRFMLFDGVGLVLMGIAYVILKRQMARH